MTTPFAAPPIVEVATILKPIFIAVAELVAYVFIQPTVRVEVALAAVGIETFPLKVEAPPTVKVPWVAILPLEAVVVAKPLTIKLPAIETGPVVDALTKLARPVTPRVVPTVTDPSVLILVLIVEEAFAAIALIKIPNKNKDT